jgi:hypothetical protein
MACDRHRLRGVGWYALGDGCCAAGSSKLTDKGAIMMKTTSHSMFSSKENRSQSPVLQCLDTLGEAHNENVYDAIERLVQAGEQVGFSVHDLIHMLDGGMSLETLFDLIEIRMTTARN